jgi:arsenate reductase
MAEALLRQMYGERYEAQSAGTEPGSVHPLAVQALAELGIDVSGARPKGMDTFDEARFDVAVTVCDAARETCPVVPGASVQLHWDLPDPSQADGDEDAQLAVFRSVRDEIRRRVEDTFGRA